MITGEFSWTDPTVSTYDDEPQTVFSTLRSQANRATNVLSSKSLRSSSSQPRKKMENENSDDEWEEVYDVDSDSTYFVSKNGKISRTNPQDKKIQLQSRLRPKRRKPGLWMEERNHRTGLPEWVDLETGIVVNEKPTEGTIIANIQTQLQSIEGVGRSQPEEEQRRIFTQEEEETNGVISADSTPDQPVSVEYSNQTSDETDIEGWTQQVDEATGIKYWIDIESGDFSRTKPLPSSGAAKFKTGDPRSQPEVARSQPNPEVSTSLRSRPLQTSERRDTSSTENAQPAVGLLAVVSPQKSILSRSIDSPSSSPAQSEPKRDRTVKFADTNNGNNRTSFGRGFTRSKGLSMDIEAPNAMVRNSPDDNLRSSPLPTRKSFTGSPSSIEENPPVFQNQSGNRSSFSVRKSRSAPRREDTLNTVPSLPLNSDNPLFDYEIEESSWAEHRDPNGTPYWVDRVTGKMSRKNPL